MCVFFFKQKTAYEMRISDWSSDVCSTDLLFAQQAIGVIGGVFTPFHPLGAPADFAYILNDAGIDIVIVDEARHADMARAIELSGRSPLVLTLGGGGEHDLNGLVATEPGSRIKLRPIHTEALCRDRTSGVWGKGVSGRVDLGGRR